MLGIKNDRSVLWLCPEQSRVANHQFLLSDTIFMKFLIRFSNQIKEFFRSSVSNTKESAEGHFFSLLAIKMRVLHPMLSLFGQPGDH